MKKIIPENIARKPVIWELRKVLLYMVSTWRAFFYFKTITVFGGAAAYFFTWYKSVKRNNDPLLYDQPWVVFKAKIFLDRLLNAGMSVWEYGSGSSTLYFSRRVEQVYSVENDKEWFNHLHAFMKDKQIGNVHYTLIQAEAPSSLLPMGYISRSVTANGKSFETYVKSIDRLPDNSMDVVLVDGRARGACIAHAIPKVKAGGFLVVDNSDRNYYFEGNEQLFDDTDWEATHFIGPVPYSFDFSQTSFFLKKQTPE